MTLSIALLIFSVLWLISATVFIMANLGSKDGMSAAPLWTMLVLILLPISSLIVAPCLICIRKTGGQTLGAIDQVALWMSLAPAVFFVVLFVVIFVMGAFA